MQNDGGAEVQSEFPLCAAWAPGHAAPPRSSAAAEKPQAESGCDEPPPAHLRSLLQPSPSCPSLHFTSPAPRPPDLSHQSLLTVLPEVTPRGQ